MPFFLYFGNEDESWPSTTRFSQLFDLTCLYISCSGNQDTKIALLLHLLIHTTPHVYTVCRVVQTGIV